MSLIGLTPKENCSEYPRVIHSKVTDLENGEKNKCPSLMELAAKTLVLNKIKLDPDKIPSRYVSYVENGHKCIMPDCNKVYFVQEQSRFREYSVVMFICAACEEKYAEITSAY